MSRRVVVTGLGAVTPLGLTVDESWRRALAGESGISKITRFATEGFDVQIAGEVKGFNSDQWVAKKEQKKMDLFIHYSLAATKMALDQAGLVISESLAPKTGVIIGVGMGGLPAIEAQHKILLERGPGRISPFFIPMVITNLAAGQISISFGAKGPSYCVTSACASGAHSIGEATEMIRRGVTDVMIAGGTEATVCPTAVGGFAAMRALSTRNDSPTRASRPWDKDRDGFVLSEGAATLILEERESAIRRGATILAEVVGYGASSDANHMTSPAPGGAGAVQAMRQALENAKLNPEDIGYINAHGTSTPTGDELETEAIKTVWGYNSKKVWVSSTKSVTGHTLGAAGAIESVFCIMALKDQKAPPTINLENPSEGCDLDYVPNQARDAQLRYVMNNSFGFGGTNCSIVFAKH